MSDLIHFTLLVVVYLMPCGNVPIQLDVFCLFFYWGLDFIHQDVIES